MKSELEKYLESLSSIGAKAVEAVTETVDSESKLLFENIKEGTPVRTGALKESLIMTKLQNGTRYGYRIDYEGYNENGVPYSLIGRSLNKGTATIEPVKHIDKAVRKLRGMDQRIDEAFQAKLENLKE